MAFDPNKPEFNPNKPTPEWATYLEGRRPKFKIHTNLGNAKNALNVKYPHEGGIIYQWVDGQWEEWDRSVIPENCPWCDKPFKDATSIYLSTPCTVSKAKFSYKTPVVCWKCYGDVFSFYAKDQLGQRDKQVRLDSITELYRKCGVERHKS